MSSNSKDENSTLLNRTMESASLMVCGILFQEFGAVYIKLLLVCSNFNFCTCRFFIFLVL